MPDLVDYLRDKLDHADDAVCSCPQIPLCGFPEGLPPNPHTLRGWSPDCAVHADEETPTARLWAAMPVAPCRCGLAKETE